MQQGMALGWEVEDMEETIPLVRPRNEARSCGGGQVASILAGRGETKETPCLLTERQAAPFIAVVPTPTVTDPVPGAACRALQDLSLG